MGYLDEHGQPTEYNSDKVSWGQQYRTQDTLPRTDGMPDAPIWGEDNGYSGSRVPSGSGGTTYKPKFEHTKGSIIFTLLITIPIILWIFFDSISKFQSRVSSFGILFILMYIMLIGLTYYCVNNTTHSKVPALSNGFSLLSVFVWLVSYVLAILSAFAISKWIFPMNERALEYSSICSVLLPSLLIILFGLFISHGTADKVVISTNWKTFKRMDIMQILKQQPIATELTKIDGLSLIQYETFFENELFYYYVGKDKQNELCVSCCINFLENLKPFHPIERFEQIVELKNRKNVKCIFKADVYRYNAHALKTLERVIEKFNLYNKEALLEIMKKNLICKRNPNYKGVYAEDAKLRVFYANDSRYDYFLYMNYNPYPVITTEIRIFQVDL